MRDTRPLEIRQAEVLAGLRRTRELGQLWPTVVNVAHLLADSLLADDMPASFDRATAAAALKDWAPYLPEAERAHLLGTLRKASNAQLGPDLAAYLAQQPGKVHPGSDSPREP